MINNVVLAQLWRWCFMKMIYEDKTAVWNCEEMKNTSTIFSCWNSARICCLIGLLLQTPGRCIGTLSTSVISSHVQLLKYRLTCAFFTVCIHGMNWLLVGMIMHGDAIYWMKFKPWQTCRYEFPQTEEYLLKQSGCIAEHLNHVYWRYRSKHSMHMCWFPIAVSTCACADSRICYLPSFRNMESEHNRVLFGLKLGWGFRHLWRWSNNNKGGQRYHIIPTILTWLLDVTQIFLYPRPSIQNKPK